MTLTDGPTDWELDPWDSPEAAPATEQLRRQSRAAKWVVWSALVVGVVAVLVAGWTGWWYVRQINPTGQPGPPASFTVVEDDTLMTISERLEAEGFIVDAGVFRWYVEHNGGLELTPGYYELRPGDHVGNLLGRLRTPPAQTYTKVTFPEGFTLAQMAERLAEVLPRMSAEEFLAAASDPGLVPRLRPEGIASLEGLLFPDTYQVSNSENEAQVIERMIALMERVAVQEDLETGSTRFLRSPYEVLIVASMIEREAKLDEDRPKIARVIWNRLQDGIPLQIDATLRYGTDPNLSIAELREIDFPHNTYLHLGLPPTPIANPGRASIQAALNPAPRDLPPGDPLCADLADRTTGCRLYYYVLADEDGGHAFAVTLEQHEANIQRAREAGLL